jgi:hypothetical protein
MRRCVAPSLFEWAASPTRLSTGCGGRLPIGSGEIESAHRYVAQQRLKRPGAWWRVEAAFVPSTVWGTAPMQNCQVTIGAVFAPKSGRLLARC